MVSTSPQDNRMTLDIPLSTLLKVTGFAITLYVVAKSFGVLLMVYVSLIIASALRPIVNYAKYLKIPKIIAILVIYMTVILAVASLLWMITPSIFRETNRFINSIPGLAEDLSARYEVFSDLVDRPEVREFLRSSTNTLSGWLSGLSSGVLSNAWSITSSVFGTVFGLFLILMMSFYMIVGENELVRSLASAFPPNQRKNIPPLIHSIQHKLGAWLRGQLSLMLVVGVAYYVGFTIIGAPYAVPLAVIGGVLEVVPIIGPNLTGLIAVLVFLPDSLFTALLGVGVVFIVQQLENALFVPMIMKQAVGLNPLVIIISLSVGSEVFGLAGAILAVPLVVTVKIIVEFYQQYEKEQAAYQERRRMRDEETETDRRSTLRSILQKIRLSPKMEK